MFYGKLVGKYTSPMDPVGSICSLHFLPSKWPGLAGLAAAAEAGIVQSLIRDHRGIFKRHDIELEIDTNNKKRKHNKQYTYIIIYQKLF